MLWEFEDECIDPATGIGAACDQDGNNQPDLGFSWSKVNTGRVLVLPAGVTDPANAVVKFVAIFGGGLDPDNVGDSGNFLYMVDIETGKTLWKRSVVGSVPSEPAAVDTDRNGIIDTLYVGTTAGLMYKADLSAAGPISSSTGRVDDTNVWAPFAAFTTGGREIFFPPSVIFEATSGHTRSPSAPAIGRTCGRSP